MALSQYARRYLQTGMSWDTVAKEVADAIDAASTSASPTFTGTITVSGATFSGAATESGLWTFTGGGTITTTAWTITDVNVVLSTNTGTMFGNANNQKLGLWGATPVVQPSSTGELLGMNGNGATNANAVNQNSNGNVGSTFYTFSDVVKALKQAGVIKS